MARTKKTPTKKLTSKSKKQTSTVKKRGKGRPAKIEKFDLKAVQNIAELNLTDKKIAYALNISTVTLNAYKKKYPEFLNSLKKGKAIIDEKVVLSLFQRCV